MNFDVIVVGGGPAGCAAAVTCKQQGLHTLILAGNSANKLQGPFETYAAESVHPGIVSLLKPLQASSCIDAAVRGYYKRILAGETYNHLGHDEHGEWEGYHIDRKSFDNALLKTALQQEIDVLEEDAVDVSVSDKNHITVFTGTGGSFTCRWLIDASGYRSFTSKKLGFKETFYSPPLVSWTGVSDKVYPGHPFIEEKTARFIPHANGWTWLAPELNGRCSWTRLETKGKQSFLPPQELSGFPVIGNIKKANRRWRVYRPLCTEGVILCGDAAGVLDPAAGQGILNALHSGIMAAKTVTSCIALPNLTAIYLAQYDGWFLDDFRKKTEQLNEFYMLHKISIGIFNL